MENWYRFVSGAAASLAAVFAPVIPSISCAIFFIGVDFVTGVIADRAVTLRAGRPWYFESRKAWRTVVKLALTLTAIVMAWIVDCYVLDFLHLNAARLFTGFTCGVEFWSFLENASQISDSPLFGWMRRYVRQRIARQTGLPPEPYV